jgi:hypothetical protein
MLIVESVLQHSPSDKPSESILVSDGIILRVVTIKNIVVRYIVIIRVRKIRCIVPPGGHHNQNYDDRTKSLDFLRE